MGTTLDAELLQAQVAAIAAQQHRTLLDARDPLAETLTPAMARVDALVELARQAALHGDAPRNGGDRPRIVAVINHQQLLADCTKAGLLRSGEELTAHQLRLLACDAEILPQTGRRSTNPRPKTSLKRSPRVAESALPAPHRIEPLHAPRINPRHLTE